LTLGDAALRLSGCQVVFLTCEPTTAPTMAPKVAERPISSACLADFESDRQNGVKEPLQERSLCS
jgi:hypothetical protein